VHEVVRSPGRDLDSQTRRELETRFGHDFSRVRVHTDERAAESARAVNARAYTVGRDIVFDEGLYAPSTASGRTLLAHELAHVVQQQAADVGGTGLVVAPSDDPAEREAEHAAATTGSPSNSFAATPIALRRDEGDEEVVEEEVEAAVDEARRDAAADGARVAIDRIRLALQRGYLFDQEVVEGESIRSIEGDLETRAAREARLRRLTVDLHDLLVQLDAREVPDEWFSPVTRQPGILHHIGGSQPWRDISALYVNRQVSLGRDLEASAKNIWYIQSEPLPERRTRPAVIGGGIQTGRFVVVPDPENEPLRVYSVSPSTTSTEGEIVELWRDDLGYYYLHGGRKIYLPKGAF
jgi:hypothetical protein